MAVAKGLPTPERLSMLASGGRTWWAHLAFTRIDANYPPPKHRGCPRAAPREPASVVVINLSD